MFCQKCGSEMEMLPDLFFHSGKKPYGCKKCNTVIDYNFCSVSGRDMGTKPNYLTYQEYMKRVAEKVKSR